MSKKSDGHLHLTTAPPWFAFLRANWLIPVTLLLLWPVSWLVDDSGQIDPYTRRIVMLIGINALLAVSLQLINGISGQFSLGHAGFMAVGAYFAAYPLRDRSAHLSDPVSIVAFFVALGVIVIVVGVPLFLMFFGMARTSKIHASLPSILVVLLAIWFCWDISASAKMESPAGYLVWSQMIYGTKAFFGWLLTTLTAPAASISTHIPTAIQPGLCFASALLGGGLCAAVAGLMVGMPTLRLRGDYLAIATLGFGEIIRVIITNTPALGAATGMTGIPPVINFAWLYGSLIIATVCVWRIARSAKGRNLAAVREDEIAASAVGISPTYHKVLAFVIGAFIAGVAGGLFASLDTYINPKEFGFLRSVEIVVYVTLGGLGSISGAIITAAILTLLPEWLRGFSELRMIIYSLLLIVMMLVRPQGLLGNRELWPSASFLRKWRGKRHGSPVLEPGDSPTVEQKNEELP